jgi:hypothetical protein
MERYFINQFLGPKKHRGLLHILLGTIVITSFVKIIKIGWDEMTSAYDIWYISRTLF